MSRTMGDTKVNTPPLKRHAALVPLSRDHHFALMQSLALRRAADGDTHPAHGRISAAESYLAFYDDELVGHMADEEVALLPAAATVAAEAAQRIRQEHDVLHERTAALREALANGDDVSPLLVEIGGLLHDHVRFEERVFFEDVQQRLPPAQLEDVRRAIEEHRRTRGIGPGCHLPPPLVLPPSR